MKHLLGAQTCTEREQEREVIMTASGDFLCTRHSEKPVDVIAHSIAPSSSKVGSYFCFVDKEAES